MCNSVVNVFSKQARFPVLGPIPSNAGDLKGLPITNHFLSFVNFEAGQRFLETGEVSRPGNNSIESRGPVRVANHIGYYFSLIFKLEIYVQLCGQRFLETCEVSGPATNSIECRGPERVANHKGFYFYR